MDKYFIYIGSNNDTHKLETKRSIDIVSKYFEGFTAYEVIGYWKGSKEKTLKVEIVGEDSSSSVIITKMCKELKEALHQEAIMLEKVTSNVAFIQ